MTHLTPTSAPAIALDLLSVPDPAWAFETTMFSIALSNFGLPELADPVTAKQFSGTIDLHLADGTLVRRMATLPLPNPVAVGGSQTFGVGLEMKALAGDYQLRLGLQLQRPGGQPVTVQARTLPTPLRVKYTIFDAFVELVNACNFRCTFCPQTTLQRPQRPMDFELATKVVRDLADMGHHYPIRVHLLGEPLLYKRFFDFVDATHGMGQRILLATNGSRFLPENVAGIFRTRLDEMVISLNTPEEKLYDEQRGTTVPYSEYIAGIERMVTEVVRRGPPPKTRINVLYDVQRHDDPIQLAKVRAVASEWVSVVERVSGKRLPPVEETIHLTPGRTTLMPLCEGLELQWTSYHAWGERGAPSKHFCSFPWRQLAVLVDGKATACCVDAEGEIVLGDAKVQSVEQIWNGPELNRLREGFLAQRAVHPRCVRCDVTHHIDEFFPGMYA